MLAPATPRSAASPAPSARLRPPAPKAPQQQAPRPCPDCRKPLTGIPCPQCGWEPPPPESEEASEAQDFGILGQLKAIPGLIVSPRTTLLAIPSDRICLVGFLISFYFAYARTVRTGAMTRAGGGLLAWAILLVLAVLAYALGALVLKGITRLFGKSLSWRKVMNLVGYSQAPRLLLSLPLSLVAAFLAADTRAAFLENTAVTIVLVVGGAGLLLYSLALLIWGLVISPDQRRD